MSEIVFGILLFVMLNRENTRFLSIYEERNKTWEMVVNFISLYKYNN